MLQRILMKAFLGLLLVLVRFSQSAYCEGDLINFTAQYDNLGAVLQRIQQDSGIRLVYVNSVVDSFRVFRKFQDTPYEAVRKSLIGTPLDFIRKSSDLWVIVPKEQTKSLPAVVTGRVVDIHLEQGIAGANVFVEDSQLGTATDGQGFFELSGIPPGRVNLSLRRIGYHDQDLEISIRGNSHRRVNVALEPKPISTREVVVEETVYPKQSTALLAYQEIDRSQLRTPPLANDGEVFEVLHRQPGVSRRDLDDVFPHVEGGSATEVMVELDGMPIYVPTFGQNRRSVFAAPALESVTLRRAGYDAEYGDAMSGIVSLKTVGFEDQSMLTQGSASLTGLFFNFNKNTKKLGVAGIWRNGKDRGDIRFDRWQGLDLYNKIEYRPAQNHTITGLSLLTRGSFIESNSQTTAELVSQNLGVRYDYQPRGGTSSASALVYHSALSDLQSESGFKLSRTSKFGGALQTKAGLDFYTLRSKGTVFLDSLGTYKVARDIVLPRDDAGNFFLPIDVDPADVFTQEGTVLSGYIQSKYTSKYWRLSGGARLPKDVRNGRIHVEPRARLTLTPTNRIHVSLAAGRYYQFTDRSYASEAKSGDYEGRGEFVVKLGDDLSSRADHFRLESSFMVSRDVSLSVAYFDKRYLFDDRVYLARINRWFWSVPLKRGYSYGFEYWLAKTRGPLRGWLSFTSNRQIYESKAGTLFRPYFNRDRILNLSVSYAITNTWEVKGNYFKSSGAPMRDWEPDKVVISSSMTPEVFAARFLAGDQRFGSARQYSLGLAWRFAAFAKENVLNLVASQTLDESQTGLNGFRFWASVSFSN